MRQTAPLQFGVQDLPEKLVSKKFTIAVQTRWADTDAYGHVYHPVFLTYLEVARDAWFADRLGDREVYVIVRIELDFLAELGRDVSEVVVEIVPQEVGRKSIKTLELVTDGADTTFARSMTTSVRWDATQGRTVTISDTEREALMA